MNHLLADDSHEIASHMSHEKRIRDIGKNVACCNLDKRFSLFDLILYVPVNSFSVKLGRVFLGLTSSKQKIKCLAQGHNAVVKLEPATPRSRVKHSITEEINIFRSTR